MGERLGFRFTFDESCRSRRILDCRARGGLGVLKLLFYFYLLLYPYRTVKTVFTQRPDVKFARVSRAMAIPRVGRGSAWACHPGRTIKWLLPHHRALLLKRGCKRGCETLSSDSSGAKPDNVGAPPTLSNTSCSSSALPTKVGANT